MNVSWGARGQVGVNNAPVEIAENVVGRARGDTRDGATGRLVELRRAGPIREWMKRSINRLSERMSGAGGDRRSAAAWSVSEGPQVRDSSSCCGGDAAASFAAI